MKQNEIRLNNVVTVFKREFNYYFNTPIGYIFLITFSILLNFLFFYIARFWETGRSIRGFFDLLRIVYMFFIPAITMRLWSEEKKSGTVELLFTLPLSHAEVILGKFLSALSFLGVALVSTMFIPFTVWYSASPDWMIIFGGYFGAFLLGAAYIALGIYISWLNRDQISAFMVSLIVFIFLFLLGYQPVLQFLGPFKEIAAFLSVSWHYDSLARGLLDTRDILFFTMVSALFLYLNLRSIKMAR
ncbi:MAG: ABC transporter permease subunit [Leptospiraceae bacterium]|nr:ABC transporter permease subunit [Leptospiraceae bacterium]